MSVTRAFKGIWISKEIWLSKDLTVMEKLFLVEIDSLDNDKGCYASNGHFSDFFDLSKQRCSQIIKSLEKKGYIKIEYKYDEKMVKERVIKVSNKFDRGIKFSKGGIKKIKEGYQENAKGSNTVINNTLSNTSVAAGGQEATATPTHFVRPESELIDKYGQELVDEALKIAEHADAPLAYAGGILKNWEKENITDIRQLKAKKKPGQAIRTEVKPAWYGKTQSNQFRTDEEAKQRMQQMIDSL